MRIINNLIRSQEMYEVRYVRPVVVCFGILAFCVLALGKVSSAQSVRISGVTESVRDITMSVHDEGAIKRILYSVGDIVKKGQSILELDNAREKLEMDRRKLVWESRTELFAATQRVETLVTILGRSKALFESTGSVSVEELDKLQLEHDQAVSELNQLEIAEEREELEYKIAVENYERRIVKSPINGVIVKLLNDVGEYVEPGQELIQIVDPKKCYMVCQLEEGLGRNIKKGAKADIEVMAGAQWISKTATVVFVSPVVDQASGLLEVKLEFENDDGNIRPGVPGVMLVEAALP